MDDRSTPQSLEASSESPSPAPSFSSRHVSWAGAAIVVTGIAGVTVLAVARVIPPEEWKWTLGALIVLAFRLDPRQLLTRK